MDKPVKPYRSKDINEGSAVDLDLTHLDKNRALQTPTTLRFRIDDLTNHRQVLDWTDVVTPGNTNTLSITGAQNELFTRRTKRQKMQVSVKTVSASGEIDQTPFFYDLIRLFNREEQLDV